MWKNLILYFSLDAQYLVVPGPLSVPQTNARASPTLQGLTLNYMWIFYHIEGGCPKPGCCQLWTAVGSLLEMLRQRQNSCLSPPPTPFADFCKKFNCIETVIFGILLKFEEWEGRAYFGKPVSIIDRAPLVSLCPLLRVCCAHPWTPLYANPPALIILSSLPPASEGASPLPQCQLKIIANILNLMEICRIKC